ncbi:MAG: hypothetical protein ACE37H_00515 [Phycisphaeraceae bacterium]
MITRTAMKPFALLAACLFAVGCIPVKNVEKAWNSSKADNELVGLWTQEGDGKVGFVKTDKDFLVTSGTSGLEGGCRSIETNGHKYLIVASLRAAVLGFEHVDADSKEGTLMRYKIDGDTLKMYTYDEGRLKVAIEDKKVPGEIDENDSAQLTELDAATIKWLGEIGDGPGWDEQTYTRAPKKLAGE